MFANKTERGAAAEALAQRHLERHGLKLVARNWRCAGGELDLVMRRPDRPGNTLVMVEVRKRSRSDYGDAFASVHGRKRGRVIHAAKMFLAAHPQYAGDAVRFDVVAVDGADAVEWLEAAFTAEG
ncbi:MAG TPA: YraN family protein [Nevskia sp.]|nr:YraN family protein [Nevskia sp.]